MEAVSWMKGDSARARIGFNLNANIERAMASMRASSPSTISQAEIWPMLLLTCY